MGKLIQMCSYNADVYLGWIGWAAGSFDGSYTLSETPSFVNGAWSDKELVTNCIVGKFKS